MKIYVACLASYDNGVLHGRWINASRDVESMQSEIDVMLRESPFPNVVRQDYVCPKCEYATHFDLGPTHKINEIHCCPECGAEMTYGEIYQTAEEWAIHDSEGLGEVSENTSLEEIARRVVIAEAAARYDLPVPVLLEAMEDIDEEDAESFVLMHYRGAYEDLAEFAEELYSECYDLDQIPDFLRGHIDWDGVARDMVYGGDIREIRHYGRSYVFWNYA